MDQGVLFSCVLSPWGGLQTDHPEPRTAVLPQVQ